MVCRHATRLVHAVSPYYSILRYCIQCGRRFPWRSSSAFPQCLVLLHAVTLWRNQLSDTHILQHLDQLRATIKIFYHRLDWVSSTIKHSSLKWIMLIILIGLNQTARRVKHEHAEFQRAPPGLLTWSSQRKKRSASSTGSTSLSFILRNFPAMWEGEQTIRCWQIMHSSVSWRLLDTSLQVNSSHAKSYKNRMD